MLSIAFHTSILNRAFEWVVLILSDKYVASTKTLSRIQDNTCPRRDKRICPLVWREQWRFAPRNVITDRISQLVGICYCRIRFHNVMNRRQYGGYIPKRSGNVTTHARTTQCYQSLSTRQFWTANLNGSAMNLPLSVTQTMTFCV